MSSEPCSQQLERSPNGKRLAAAKAKLGDVIRSMDEDTIIITDDNISKLKYIARYCTCSHHQASAPDFAYHWLASSRLARFLNHMSWSIDAIKWKCLASGDPVCTSVLDCLDFPEIHNIVRGLLNRISIGKERFKSLRKLACHWFCRKHREDSNNFERTLKTLRRQCGIYWSSIDSCKHAGADPDSSELDSSRDNSLISDSPETIDSTETDDHNETTASARVLQSNGRPDAGQVPGNTLPWNDPSIFEDDGEDEPLADSYPSISKSTQSLEVPIRPPHSMLQSRSDIGLPYRLPGMYDVDDLPVLVEAPVLDIPCPGLSTEKLSKPKTPHAPSRSARMPLNPSPSLKWCGYVDNETIFNDTLKRIKNGITPYKDGTDDGYIYVFKVIGSPNHVKIGRTIETIQKRGKKISPCAGDIIPVRAGYNICRVPQHKWLEITILESLKSRKCSFKCFRHKRNGCDKQMDHQEFFEIDANEAADLVEQWRQFIWSTPHDENGRLLPRWQMRIDFFETCRSRYQYLLAEPSPCKAWMTFLDPPWWIRLHMIFYEVFLYRRGNLPGRLTLIRRNWMRIFYDAAFGSSVFIVLLLYAGYHWISNPMTLPLIFFGVSGPLIWQM